MGMHASRYQPKRERNGNYDLMLTLDQRLNVIAMRSMTVPHITFLFCKFSWQSIVFVDFESIFRRKFLCSPCNTAVCCQHITPWTLIVALVEMSRKSPESAGFIHSDICAVFHDKPLLRITVWIKALDQPVWQQIHATAKACLKKQYFSIFDNSGKWSDH